MTTEQRVGTLSSPVHLHILNVRSTMDRRTPSAVLGALSLCPIDYGSISFINLNRPRTVTTTNVGNRGAPSFRIRINDHRIVLLLISNSYRERTKRFRQRERERQDSLLRKIRLIIPIIIFYSLRLYEGEIYLK